MLPRVLPRDAAHGAQALRVEDAQPLQQLAPQLLVDLGVWVLRDGFEYVDYPGDFERWMGNIVDAKSVSNAIIRQATKGVFSRHSAIDLAIRADAQEPGASKAVTEALTSALEAAKGDAAQAMAELEAKVREAETAARAKSVELEEKLEGNLRSLMLALVASKPEKAPKGKYFLAASLSSTMGPGVPVDVDSLDPASPRFFRDADGAS